MVESSREYSIRMRTKLGLRADGEWVDHVARTHREAGMTLGFPGTDQELADFRARTDRAIALGNALHGAALPSAAGSWIDQAAGGVVHVLLADPEPAELDTAAGIVAEHHAVIDLVEHSTAQLEHVKTLVCDESQRDTEFATAVLSYGIAVQDNAVELQLRHDCDPPLPEPLRAAHTAGTLLIKYTAPRFYDD